MTTPAALPSDWMWCFSADVCKTVPWIIYQGAGNFRAAFVSVPDCDKAKHEAETKTGSMPRWSRQQALTAEYQRRKHQEMADALVNARAKGDLHD